jgi:hypothetical protein
MRLDFDTQRAGAISEMIKPFPTLFAIVRRAIVAASVVTLFVAPTASIHAMPKPQKTSNSANRAKQEKKNAAAEAKKKADARKELTGRDHQGNHDSLTKQTKKGAKGDKHMNGVKQAGRAGSGKK